MDFYFSTGPHYYSCGSHSIFPLWLLTNVTMIDNGYKRCLVDNWLNDCEYFLIVVWPMTNVVHMVLLASEICCIIPVTLQCLLIVRQIVARCLITGQRLSWIKPQTCSWNVVITISWRTIVFWSMPWTFLLWSTNMTKYFLLPMSKCVKLASRSLGLWIIHPSHDLLFQSTWHHFILDQSPMNKPDNVQPKERSGEIHHLNNHSTSRNGCPLWYHG